MHRVRGSARSRARRPGRNAHLRAVCWLAPSGYCLVRGNAADDGLGTSRRGGRVLRCLPGRRDERSRTPGSRADQSRPPGGMVDRPANDGDRVQPHPDRRERCVRYRTLWAVRTDAAASSRGLEWLDLITIQFVAPGRARTHESTRLPFCRARPCGSTNWRAGRGPTADVASETEPARETQAGAPDNDLPLPVARLPHRRAVSARIPAQRWLSLPGCGHRVYLRRADGGEGSESWDCEVARHSPGSDDCRGANIGDRQARGGWGASHRRARRLRVQRKGPEAVSAAPVLPESGRRVPLVRPIRAYVRGQASLL